jgi:ABC-type nickel/cobalt efflux system permease component RcnA
MKIIRFVLAALLVLIAAVFLYAAMTVPAFAATPYLIVGLVAAVGVYLVWPKHRRPRETR